MAFDKKQSFFSLCVSLLCTAGALFLFFAYSAGTDDVLTKREIIALVLIGILILTSSFLLSKNVPARGLLLILLCSLLGSLAVNYEFPELMRLPVHLPAQNMIVVTNIEDGGNLSMTWAYWFQPRTQQGNLFLTNPDGDISFSHLIKQGTWNKMSVGEDEVLVTQEIGAEIGLPSKFRVQSGVLCLKTEKGTITVKVSGKEEPLTLTPEMTADQPIRIIMNNGLLPETVGNIFQVFLWSGALYFLILCGNFLIQIILNYQKTKRKELIYLSAFMIPILIMMLLCFFLKITPFGEKTFLINDMWGEYADYMAYFRSILSGENDLFYSFSKSLGDDLLSLLSFYVINPLNWLVCLFKPEELPLAITILVILRYGIAGLTSAIYFVKRRNCGFSALLFSTCYALMSFHIVNAENTNLRESAMVFPLVIMGIEQLIEKDTVQTYIWSLAAAIFLNYYSGYQICIFSVIYFLFYYICKEKKLSFKNAFLTFSVSSLLAAGLTAFLLIPVIFQLQNGPKTFDPSIFYFAINSPWAALFGKLLASSYDIGQIANGFPNLYTGLICAFLIPQFFNNREISIKEKCATAGLLMISILILQINPLNLALHGFSAPLWWPYRYSFIICFFLIITAQQSFSHRNGWTRLGLFLTFTIFLILTGLLFFFDYDWMTSDSIKLNLALLIAVFLLSFSYLKNGSYISGIFAIMTTLELFLNASHILFINTAYERSNTVHDYSAFYNANKPVIDRIQKEDNGFYRIEKTFSRTPNDPMLLNYNGITHYSSTLSSNVITFLQKTGFRRYPPYRILYWEGSDVAMDSLLGIKYLVSDWDISKPYIPVFMENQYTVYENPYSLPLMFTTSHDILDMDFSEEKTGFELQNKIFSALTGKETKIYHKADVSGFTNNGLVHQNNEQWYCFTKEKDNPGSLSWEINIDDTNTLYAYFPSEKLHQTKLTLNDKAFGYYYDNFSYHILRLGSFESGEILTLNMIPLEESLCLNDAQFYYEDLDTLGSAVSALRQDKTNLQKVTSSHLAGSFEASSEKMLFFTIPYNKGWTVRIDGQEAPVFKIFDIFMAVKITSGQHTVDLYYIPNGFFLGTMISLLSILIILMNRKLMKIDDKRLKLDNFFLSDL